MLDQIEPLPDDAPSGPGTLTNQAKVKQSQNTKRPSKEQKLNFKTFFFAFNYILGSISWSITLFYFNYTGSNVSSACPHRMNYGEKYLYEQNFSFDLHAFINDDETNLIWNKSKLTYGDLQSTFRFNTKVPISEYVRNNGSLYLHVCLTKSGFPPAPKKGDSWAELYTHCKTKRMNFFSQEANGVQSTQVRSYWRPNWTVNLVGNEDWGFSGKEDGRIDCEPLTKRYYPLLYLNDNFNLAEDCIPIDQTTESLPLNLIFKQIEMGKLKDYLRQSDFEEYFRHSKPYEEFIRRNLIASDFKKTGVYYIDYLWAVLQAAFLAKCALLLGLELLHSWQGTNEAGKFAKIKKVAELIADTMMINGLSVILFPAYRHIFQKYWTKEEKTVKPDQVETNCDFLLNFLHLKRGVILRNLVVFLLVPFPFLYLCFSSCPVAFSPQENLAIFTFLAICNCISYLVLDFFPLAGFSASALFVFIIAWLFSDLASSICLFELSGSIWKLKEMPVPLPKADQSG